MAQTPVDEINVGNITGTVAKITSDALAFTPKDINKIADVLEHTTRVEKVTEEVGKYVIKTVDKLMTMSENEVEAAYVETKAANRIINSLETCAEKVDMIEKDNLRLVTDNIAMEVWMLKDDSRPVIGLAAHSDETTPKKTFKEENIARVFNKSQLFDANVDAALELPNEAFAPKVKGQPARNKLTMMVFRKSKLLKMAARSSDEKALNRNENAIFQLNSYVISASIAGKRLTNLKVKEDGSNQNCVFWDFNLNDNKGGWSSEGCIYDGRINGREVCLCHHLTNFAFLLGFYGQENPIHRDHELSLSIITIIGLSFSILLTILSFVFFKFKLAISLPSNSRCQTPVPVYIYFLNSLQGFFILILFVVRKKKVREQWYIICCKDMDREKVGRSLSVSNSSSYNNGSGSRKNSRRSGKERDRSNSTKTLSSSLSSAGLFSNGYTNYGYDGSLDRSHTRRTYSNF